MTSQPIGGSRSADRPIGVCDSGVGGLSVLKALRAELPGEHYVYLADAAHAPYGERGEPYVIERTRAIVQQLRDEHAIKALVIACNTATAAAIHLVRSEHPDLPVVGVEPALKPAMALSKTGRIGVLATRGTLASTKFLALQEALGEKPRFVLQPCDGLADAIENDDVARIAALCERYVPAAGPFGTGAGQVDTLVLGCTHYPFAEQEIRRWAGPGTVLIETGVPVARQARRLLEACGQLGDPASSGRLVLLRTGNQHAIDAAAARWLRP